MRIACANCATKVQLDGPPGHKAKCPSCGNAITVPERVIKKELGVVYCTSCWTRYRASGKAPGTRFKCRHCEQMITIRPKRPSPKAAARKAELEDTSEMDADVVKAAAGAPAARRAPDSGDLQRYRKALADKDKLLKEKEDAIARQAGELVSLREKEASLSGEVSGLRSELGSKIDGLASVKTRLGESGRLLKIRDEDVAARDDRLKKLEEELSSRPSRDEVKEFQGEKEEMDRRLQEEGNKLSSFKEALGHLLEPLDEVHKRFGEIAKKTGKLKLPDFTEDLKNARREAEEKRLAFAAVRGERDDLKRTMGGLRDRIEGIEKDLEAARREASASRQAYEELRRAVEEEIGRLDEAEAAGAAPGKGKSGFFRGLFGKKDRQKISSTGKLSSSRRLKLKAASPPEPVSPGEADEEELGAAEPLEETEPVEEAEDIPPEKDE